MKTNDLPEKRTALQRPLQRMVRPALGIIEHSMDGETEWEVEALLDDEGYIAFVHPTSGAVTRLDLQPKDIQLFEALDASGETWDRGLRAAVAETLPRIVYQGPTRTCHPQEASPEGDLGQYRGSLSHTPRSYRPSLRGSFHSYNVIGRTSQLTDRPPR